MILTKMAYSQLQNFVQNGKKIVGCGLNYNGLAAARGVPKPPYPMIFTKPPSTSYVVEGQDIVLPVGFEVDEEIELGIIIGKKCKNVSEKDALDYVGGYCAALDLTCTSELTPARKAGFPWAIAKGFDTACPVSKFIPREKIPDPHNVELWCTINGKVVQNAKTNDLIFSIPYLISYISKYITLEPNDLILSGTPPGISRISPGDVIEGGIKGLESLKFAVKSAA